MARIIDRPVKVSVRGDGSPAGFFWNGNWKAVTEIIDFWADAGCWWEQEEEKVFYRVAAGGGIYELCHPCRASGVSGWRLYKVYD